MIAKFETKQDAQDYADLVHAYLSTFAGYIAERWCEVGEDNTVELYADVQPQTNYTLIQEQENNGTIDGTQHSDNE